MKYGAQKTRIRRFLRDPDANIWDSAYILASFNNIQREMAERHVALESVQSLRVPPSFNWSYQADWEYAYTRSATVVYQCHHQYQQSDFTCTQRWEIQQDLRVGGVDSSDGTMMTHPWEAWTSESPAQPVPWPFPDDFHSVSLLAYDREPLPYIDKTLITSRDTEWKTRESEPQGYYREDFTENQFIPYPRPTTIQQDDGPHVSKANWNYWMFSMEWEEDYMAALTEVSGGSGVTLGFNLGGVQEPVPGDTISGDTSGFTAVIDSINLTSGSWLFENAAGTMELSSVTGDGSGNIGENVDDDTQGFNNVFNTTSWTAGAGSTTTTLEVGFGNTFTFFNNETTDANKCWYTYEWEDGYAGQDKYLRGMWLFEIGLCLDGQVGMVTSIGAETSSAGVITGGGLHTSEQGMAVEAVDDDGNFLLVYQQQPLDIQSDADESIWPEWAQKYIECGVLARAFSANTDGKIPSLQAYWNRRYELGLQIIKKWKGNRLTDRHFRFVTQGVRPRARSRRHARLPDTFPRTNP